MVAEVEVEEDRGEKSDLGALVLALALAVVVVVALTALVALASLVTDFHHLRSNTRNSCLFVHADVLKL